MTIWCYQYISNLTRGVRDGFRTRYWCYSLIRSTFSSPIRFVFCEFLVLVTISRKSVHWNWKYFQHHSIFQPLVYWPLSSWGILDPILVIYVSSPEDKCSYRSSVMCLFFLLCVTCHVWSIFILFYRLQHAYSCSYWLMPFISLSLFAEKISQEIPETQRKKSESTTDQVER